MDESKIRALLESDINTGIIHGGVVLMGNVQQDHLAVCCGYTTSKHNVPMDLNTVIDCASTTKVTVAITALLICHQRGLVDFDAPFTKYLPEYTASLQIPITVRALANHVSGFVDPPGQQRPYFDEDGTVMLNKVLTLPPTCPPTDVCHYACWNYIILALLIENIVKCPLDEFAQCEIFQPLGMSRSSLGVPLPTLRPEELAQTMTTEKPGQISDFVARRIFDASHRTANAGLFTCANDFAKLLRCYLKHGELNNGKALFTKRQFDEIAPDRNKHFDGYRNFGWAIYEQYLADSLFGTTLFHSGWSGQTIAFNVESQRFAIVLTTRCGDYELAKRHRFDIVNSLL